MVVMVVMLESRRYIMAKACAYSCHQCLDIDMASVNSVK